MIPVAARFERVLLDSSALVSFGQAGALFQLIGYLGDSGSMVLDVEVEVRRLSTGRFPDLKTLALLRWPPGGAVSATPQELADILALQGLESRPGEHPDKNRGEIATVLVAQRLGALAVLDDALGKQLARNRALPRLSTPQLAAEMCAASSIDADITLAVFRAAVSDRPIGPADVERAVELARQNLAGGSDS